MLAENPAGDLEAQLWALRGRGFRFLDPRDDQGEVVALVGVRAHHDVLDVVRLHSESDVVAARMPGDSDVLAPARVLWERAGAAREVLDAMLALPDDWVPRPAGGCR